MDASFSEVANKAVSHYPIKADKIMLLSFKGPKSVWAIQTDAGEAILKKIPISEERLKFMIHAIEYLKGNGVRTPGVFRTKTGESYVRSDGENFILLEAIRGRSPEYEIEEELLLVLKGMALFHKASRGIEVPPGTKATSHLGEWNEDFAKRINQLEQWQQERSRATHKTEFDVLFLKHADALLEQARSSLDLLDQPPYRQWVEAAKTEKWLNHQDYAAGNLAITATGELYVYDMDSLTFDLPVRDIRKILNKVMKKRDRWDLELMVKMLKAYQEVHPLTKDQYSVLMADLRFPHLFYGQVSKYYQNREPGWTPHKHVSRLNDMIAAETSKEAVLQSFESRIDEVIGLG
ncbi:CotS family spore coat protein [Cohnella thailandensis]|uniref:CotS family spore coat protein n=1 Tax=Cohnella thailandensis TaxID=557557 RepID=A0A841SRE2_9BACL|nr:CotS family spore coat protein [Cohnella thailandensis]MBB6632635.1 CotS family spore coat protein [Cohnella thailandensis]MBP1975676.1 CotS family spore coat protein [Cohnella thailandensis]